MWVGDYISSTAVAALSTDQGIVVIDTTESPALDQYFRKIIARELGRDDFIYLINTHEHHDHTSGNGIYADCEIIAHEYCAEGMRTLQEDSQRIIDWYTERIPELERELTEAEAGGDQSKILNEELIVKKMIFDNLESGSEPTFPTRTFSDSLKLELGNMTVELYYMGGTHTASDIFVFVPEEGLLFTGDMMADVWLTDTPGCLQAFGMRQGTKRNMPLLLEHWQNLIARKDEISDYIPAHWNGDLTYEGFVDRYNYIETLNSGITQAVEQGKSLEEIFTELDRQARFPHLVGTPGFTEAFVHGGSILSLYSDITGAQSVTTALATLTEEIGLDAAISKIMAEHAAGSGKYFFLEGDLNRMGYGYIGEDKYDEAEAVFKLNVDMYPESWNAYDSLGEAYMKKGEWDLAVTNYNKSIEINPKNDNGRQMLEEIGRNRTQ
jgi:glyoxylase-like metal-dependent hydrolase (beta-lactamase superfamily II)/TolA-binding protein